MARRTADQDAKELRQKAADAEAALGMPQPSAPAAPPMAPPPGQPQPQAAAPVEPALSVTAAPPAQPVRTAPPAPAAARPVQTTAAAAATETPEEKVARLERELEEAKTTGSRAFQKIRGDYQKALTALQTGRAVQVQQDGSILLVNEPPQTRQPVASAPQPPAQPQAQISPEAQKMRADLVETYGEPYVRQLEEGLMGPLLERRLAAAVASLDERYRPYVERIDQIETSASDTRQAQVQQLFDTQLSFHHPDWKALIEGPDGLSPDPEFQQWLYAHPDADIWVPLIFPGSGMVAGTVEQHARILQQFKTANPRAVARNIQETVQQNRAAAAAASEQPRTAPTAPVIGTGPLKTFFASEIQKRHAELSSNPKALVAFANEVRQAELEGRVFDDLRDAGQPYRGAAPAA